MIVQKRFLFGLFAFVSLALFLSACENEGMFDRYKKKKGNRREIDHYEIHQPDVNYPNDDVLIWHTPSRNKRKFKLPPGTHVEVLETVDGDKVGSSHIMYKIRTADGREGWVPKGWCKQVYKETN